jgi:bifunctional non-homologous end joining protein LigD
LQAEAKDHAKFVVTGIASAYLRRTMKLKPLPAGFIVPAQPVLASRPPSGPAWVHEIKHDGYRMIVRRDGPTVRLYSRNAYDWTARLAAIAAAAERIKAKSFTIDGEAVVLGPDGLSRFEELSRRAGARTAALYAFDLIEHDGEDMRNRPFLDRKNALARLLRNTEAGILFNEHIAEDGPIVFAHACRLGAEGIVSKKVDSTYQSGPCRVWIKVRNPASINVQRERSELWNR